MYPTLYEINTRPWIKTFGQNTTLSDIPDHYWIELKDRGVDYIWLMGVWQTSPTSIAKHCFHPDLVRSYDRVSSHWRKEDITGSPYAIEDYVVSDLLGTTQDLLSLKQQINGLGIKLILDFIPNHFNTDSKLVQEHPNVFLQVNHDLFESDKYTYFKKGDLYFAHGRDPYFAAWSDTVQINYFSKDAHIFMQQKLNDLTSYCDGLRCDMAMLVLPDIFEKTWGHTTELRYQLDFWSMAIQKIKNRNPHFIFMAEAYWDTEWRLHQLGFDYTYDNTLLDLLQRHQISDLKGHLSGTLEYQEQTVRFIENHDEERSLTTLGEEMAKASALLYATLPGMRLHYDGQWKGERQRYPVQMGTFFPSDECPCTLKNQLRLSAYPCSCMSGCYDELLAVTNRPVFKLGAWNRLQVEPKETNCVVMSWSFQDGTIIVALNLGKSECEVKTRLPQKWKNSEVINDLLNSISNPTYIEFEDHTLVIRLPAFKTCLLST
ncbi:MAG: glycosidase [Saprospiraceae bacterium]|nr:glycosidase [Saprospiraceae bacterium]